ncbi:MAG: hypothetical protein ABI045_04855 [Flavobacteriales bacterium]
MRSCVNMDLPEAPKASGGKYKRKNLVSRKASIEEGGRQSSRYAYFVFL